MRVATFNLENLDLRPGQEDVFALRVAVLRPILDRLAADVLCLQEVNA
jgi:exonuclease III